ncbi:Bacteriophage Mu Gp45 protein [Faunimonas pinastri]|uniref:Bacteriophage Mu Gp45 protein n=1 Tax=Faunimonas pinastri TaxID=1855383 RepID=A0A1H9GEP5_9HYPH|nr:phage baseplate assembly protein [Faunimonas pinastri]SEQ48278.1 Bacteriophage Mu Gp45 protein [Faunimonas pinastri]
MHAADLFRFQVSETQDDGAMQTLKGLGYASEELTGVHRVMPFGLASFAPAGSHALAVAMRGQRSLVAALGLEHPDYRLRNRETGSTAIYDMHGNVVSLVQQSLRIVHAEQIALVCGSASIVITKDGKMAFTASGVDWQQA